MFTGTVRCRECNGSRRNLCRERIRGMERRTGKLKGEKREKGGKGGGEGRRRGKG